MENFKVVKEIDGIYQLQFNSLYPKECCDYAVAHNIRRVGLFPGVYTDKNLEPLMPLKDILEGLILNEDVDFSQLHRFKNLRVLGALDNKRNTVDLKFFPNLEILACNITERLLGLEFCKNLKHITINSYRPKSQDLSKLQAVKSLESIFFVKASLLNLKGIERFGKLKKLSLFFVPNLESIAAISALSDSLNQVEIEKCKKIKSYDVLGNLIALERIRISKSGEIKSLSFVKSLPKLKFISFWGTNVLDGDISCCKGIAFVGFDNKRHYSHKAEHFK